MVVKNIIGWAHLRKTAACAFKVVKELAWSTTLNCAWTYASLLVPEFIWGAFVELLWAWTCEFVEVHWNRWRQRISVVQTMIWYKFLTFARTLFIIPVWLAMFSWKTKLWMRNTFAHTTIRVPVHITALFIRTFRVLDALTFARVLVPVFVRWARALL